MMLTIQLEVNWAKSKLIDSNNIFRKEGRGSCNWNLQCSPDHVQSLEGFSVQRF